MRWRCLCLHRKQALSEMMTTEIRLCGSLQVRAPVRKQIVSCILILCCGLDDRGSYHLETQIFAQYDGNSSYCSDYPLPAYANLLGCEQGVSGSTFSEKAKWIYQYSLKTCSSIVDGFYTMRECICNVPTHSSNLSPFLFDRCSSGERPGRVGSATLKIICDDVTPPTACRLC